jgi:hypothetical protein
VVFQSDTWINDFLEQRWGRKKQKQSTRSYPAKWRWSCGYRLNDFIFICHQQRNSLFQTYRSLSWQQTLLRVSHPRDGRVRCSRHLASEWEQHLPMNSHLQPLIIMKIARLETAGYIGLLGRKYLSDHLTTPDHQGMHTNPGGEAACTSRSVCGQFVPGPIEKMSGEMWFLVLCRHDHPLRYGWLKSGLTGSGVIFFGTFGLRGVIRLIRAIAKQAFRRGQAE